MISRQTSEQNNLNKLKLLKAFLADFYDLSSATRKTFFFVIVNCTYKSQAEKRTKPKPGQVLNNKFFERKKTYLKILLWICYVSRLRQTLYVVQQIKRLHN